MGIKKKKKKNLTTSIGILSFLVTVGSQIVAHTLIETGDGPNRPNTIDL